MSQSDYIPWRGYFDFIDDVDLFVLYDDVPYGTGKKWRNRNKIRTRRDTQWITVPLQHGREHTPIDRVLIDPSKQWQRKHLDAIFENYRRAPFVDAYIGEYETIIGAGHETISELNFALLQWILDELEIDTELRSAREYGIEADSREERPLVFLEALGATSYLLGPAAEPYTDREKYVRRGITLAYKSYAYEPYVQAFEGFVGEVTVLDLLFNLGPRSSEHLKSTLPNRVEVSALELGRPE